MADIFIGIKYTLFQKGGAFKIKPRERREEKEGWGEKREYEY